MEKVKFFQEIWKAIKVGVIFKRILPFLIILFIAVIGYIGGWWDVGSVVSRKVQSSKPAVPSIDMEKTKLTGWDEDKKSWEIEARRTWQSADGNIVYFRKITHGVAFSMKGEQVDFKAGWARWERIPQNLYIGGGLEAKVSDCIVKTKEAVIDYRKEIMTSKTAVQMNQKDTLVTAKSLEIKLSEEEMDLAGDVVLVQNKNRVAADGMKFFHKDETYQLIDPKGVTIIP
jgi:LPS export ABC transporter protein LptC